MLSLTTFLSYVLVALLVNNFAILLVEAAPLLSSSAGGSNTPTITITVDQTTTVWSGNSLATHIPIIIAPPEQNETSSSINPLLTSTTPTTTVTITSTPQTVTEVVTLDPRPTSSPSSSDTSPSAKTWSSPPQFTDLSCFGIDKFAYGKQNVKVVAINEKKSGEDDVLSNESNENDSPLTDPHTALRLHYPAGSINPGNQDRMQGGADFYASPIDLSSSQNVTLEYSVYFPSNFSFVKGGKLPGLYGGRSGCSGGDEALDCFSTRLMWRSDGEGELYLYAPKKSQGPQVCSTPPQSVCESDYGLSIGRGSFVFAPGTWTKLTQTVTLNTPGEQDGAFTLDVNGVRAIDVEGVYYRQADAETDTVSSANIDPAEKKHGRISLIGPNTLGHQALRRHHRRAGPQWAISHTPVKQTLLGTGPLTEKTIINGAKPGQLSRNNAPGMRYGTGMVRGYSRNSRRGMDRLSTSPASVKRRAPLAPDPAREGHLQVSKAARHIRGYGGLHPVLVAPAIHGGHPPSGAAPRVKSKHPLLIAPVEGKANLLSSGSGGADEVLTAAAKDDTSESDDDGPIGFIGIFFSTFFGGHDEEWASPTDQYSWFKDFSLRIDD